MSTARESFFECSCASALDQRTMLVRAWSAAEAERTFREVLENEGVREPGRIVVTGLTERYAATLPTRQMTH